jgi:hypothetical protein
VAYSAHSFGKEKEKDKKKRSSCMEQKSRRRESKTILVTCIEAHMVFGF